MATSVIRIPITNTYAGGDYTGTIYVGSQKKPVNVLLDTGSSTLAVEESAYNPTSDPAVQITDLIQEVSYVDNSGWIGSVVLADICLGQGTGSVTLPKVNTAVAYSVTKSMFGKYDGILGLAYTKLNDAYVMPGKTFPPNHNYNQVQGARKTFINPIFTQLEDAGLVANKFAFYTLRSMLSLAQPDVTKDPLNSGFLILGGGEESTDLYTGTFQNIRVLDDLYYNTNLTSVVVGGGTPIAVPPPTKSSGNATNSVIDSGTNSLLLDQNLYNAIAKEMGTAKARLLSQGQMPIAGFNPSDWPAIAFIFEGDAGSTVKLVVQPSTYWQTNAGEKGLVVAAMRGDNGELQGQSILGLPLMNNYFMLFDRSVDQGLGVIKCAAIKNP